MANLLTVYNLITRKDRNAVQQYYCQATKNIHIHKRWHYTTAYLNKIYELADALLPDDDSLPSGAKPFKTLGNGNCLFNAAK